MLTAMTGGGIEMGTRFHRAMINEGVLTISPGAMTLSTAMNVQDIEYIASAAGRCVDSIIAERETS